MKTENIAALVLCLAAALAPASWAGDKEDADKLKLRIQVLEELRAQDEEAARDQRRLMADRYDDQIESLRWQLDEVNERAALERRKGVDEPSREKLKTLQTRRRGALESLRSRLDAARVALVASLDDLKLRLSEAKAEAASSAPLLQAEQDLRAARKEYAAELARARAEMKKEHAVFQREVRMLLDKTR